MCPSPDDSEKNFFFGFQKVTAESKTENVKSVFTRVASRYNLMNDTMSLGLHRRWKRLFVNSLPLIQDGTYLDVAGGTGDIGQALFSRLSSFGIPAQILVSDINPSMVHVGQSHHPHLTWLCSNGETLPLEDNSVDVYTISFGLRNVTHREKALCEAYRVLKPGGKFACMEFSHVSPPLQTLYDFYLFHVIPKLGDWIAQDKESYQYLSESIRTFLTPQDLLDLLKQVGFESTNYSLYSKGIVALHSGYKL